MKYLVTGATGGFGNYALEFLKKVFQILSFSHWFVVKKRV